mmetsp:Transcript_170512/g.541678  ORF Transcript_170512/g.541678 Transcript_170512/m.541678 type:complete len:207 (+) Transcript_170512:352-972(+)
MLRPLPLLPHRQRWRLPERRPRRRHGSRRRRAEGGPGVFGARRRSGPGPGCGRRLRPGALRRRPSGPGRGRRRRARRAPPGLGSEPRASWTGCAGRRRPSEVASPRWVQRREPRQTGLESRLCSGLPRQLRARRSRCRGRIRKRAPPRRERPCGRAWLACMRSSSLAPTVFWCPHRAERWRGRIWVGRASCCRPWPPAEGTALAGV